MQNTEILAPVSTEAQSISEAAEIGRQIGANWQKATKEVLDTAGLCDAAFRRPNLKRQIGQPQFFQTNRHRLNAFLPSRWR